MVLQKSLHFRKKAILLSQQLIQLKYYLKIEHHLLNVL